MPELGKLKQVQQGTIRIIGVTGDVLHPASVETAIINWEGDPYEGPYEVTPHFSEQTLETEHKTMSSDVTVHEIPVVRTSNLQGGLTVVIG